MDAVVTGIGLRLESEVTPVLVARARPLPLWRGYTKRVCKKMSFGGFRVVLLVVLRVSGSLSPWADGIYRAGFTHRPLSSSFLGLITFMGFPKQTIKANYLGDP